MNVENLPDTEVSTEADGLAHGLSADEYARAVEICGRAPNLLELGIFSVMWSEHCSYKSSKKWLRQFPTEAPWVIHGPGENAGAVAIGDSLALGALSALDLDLETAALLGAAPGAGSSSSDIFAGGSVVVSPALLVGRGEATGVPLSDLGEPRVHLRAVDDAVADVLGDEAAVPDAGEP